MREGKGEMEDKREWRRGREMRKRKGNGEGEKGREKWKREGKRSSWERNARELYPPPVPPAAANFFEVCAGFRIL